MATCDSCNKGDAKCRCSNCKSYYYCDINCSKLHWSNGHRAECKMITDNNKKITSEDTHISMLVKKLMNISVDDKCSICLEELSITNAFILPCNHFLCNKCIFELPGKELDYGDEIIEECPQCPLCRANMPMISDLLQYLYQMSALFVQRAYRLPPASEERLQCCTAAKNQTAKIQHFLKERPIGQLQLYLKLVDSDLIVCEGLDPRKGLELAKELLEMKELDLSFRIDQLINTGDCYILLEEFNEARKSFTEAFKLCEPSMAKRTRKIFHQLTRCYYELKDYEAALMCGDSAIEMNRHYDGVYKYLAMTHKALGNIDEAIAVMKRAVLYETPWNPENVSQVKDLLAELEKEKNK